MDGKAGEFATVVEVRQSDDTEASGDDSPHFLKQLAGCEKRASCGDQVVTDEDAVTFVEVLFLKADGVGTILKLVFLFPDGSAQFASFANHEGHINGTYVCSFSDGSQYTLQNINNQVFPHPEEVMENIALVTAHIREKIAGLPDADQRCLSLIPSKKGALFVKDEKGGYWRMYRYITHAARSGR